MMLIKFLIMKIFSSLFPKKEPILDFSADEFENVKFKARIALVDDEEVEHVKRLQKEGYNIVDYPDIDNIDDFLRKRYHVIILDIQGVGKKLAKDQEGWALLKYIKNESPHIVVIMFTGADWSVTKYKNQVDLADDFIGKDLEYLDFKSKLDAAIRKAFSSKFHFEIEKRRISSEVLNSTSLNAIEDILFTYGQNRKKALSKVRKLTNNQDVINAADNFLSIISSITSLITS